MSVTEVIHTHVKKASVGSGRLLLPTDPEESDLGLVMKIDSNLKSTKMSGQPSTTSTSPIPIGVKNPSAVRPSAVSSQLCGQGHEVTGWVLRGVLFIQTTHIPFIKFTHKMGEVIQKKTKLLMPIFLYMSLLVLVAQAAAVVMMFSQSFMPMGMWFLLACIGILAGMFCYTIVMENPHNRNQSKFVSGSKQL